MTLQTQVKMRGDILKFARSYKLYKTLISCPGCKAHLFLRRVIFSSLACLALPHLSTVAHKRNDLRKKLLKVKCVLIFSTPLV